MKYQNICPAIFKNRPNRFIAETEINSRPAIAHVKNTGRCKELLIPGARVYLDKSDNLNRKTMYDLVAVEKGKRLINMDSQAPNKVFLEYLQSGKYIKDITFIKPETTYGNSRFDFYIETNNRKIFIEIKGVTLEENGIVLFPDAPTERGVKHLQELSSCLKEGYEAHVVFIIQMNNVKYFIPNDRTHPAFGEALRKASQTGVKITAYNCNVTPDTLNISAEIPVKL